MIRRRVVAESVEWLVTERGPVAVRFSLGLAPGEHVCGFGERFDVVDQRGRRLDTVVFEQYKQQGSRTYLPSPFAIVAGGAGAGASTSAPRGGAGSTSAPAIQSVWWSKCRCRTSNQNRTLAVEVAIYEGDPAAVLPPTSTTSAAQDCLRRGCFARG